MGFRDGSGICAESKGAVFLNLRRPTAKGSGAVLSIGKYLTTKQLLALDGPIQSVQATQATK